MRDAIVSFFGRKFILPVYQKKYRRFIESLERSAEARQNYLLDLVRRSQYTDFGRRHGFSAIQTIDDFRRGVPTAEYQDLKPFLDRVADGEQTALLPAEEKILAFACTTGSTGVPKRFPVTRSWLDSYQRWWQMWGAKSITDHPGIATKRWLQISGALEIDQTLSGHSVGMVSAISARYQNPIFQLFYCIPYQIGDLTDPELRQYALARLSIAYSVGFIITITPGNLIQLAQTADLHKEDILRDVHDGTLKHLAEIAPASLRSRLSHMLHPMPRRARELDELIKQHGVLYPKHYWDLELISCWTAGTVGYQSRDLPQYYGKCPIRDIGYISTEGRHTITVDDASAPGVLVPSDSFYEFMPAEGTEPLLPHELQSGHDYSVLLTSANGLFRYALGDIVRCQGAIGQSPILEFLRKTADFSDMEGEKLSAEQAITAVRLSAAQLGIEFTGFSFFGERQVGGRPHYAILMEGRNVSEDARELMAKLAKLIDDELISMNMMYRQKRRDGSLSAPCLTWLPRGAWNRFACHESRKRRTGESQFKQPVFLTPSQMSEIRALLQPSAIPPAVLATKQTAWTELPNAEHAKTHTQTRPSSSSGQGRTA